MSLLPDYRCNMENNQVQQVAAKPSCLKTLAVSIAAVGSTVLLTAPAHAAITVPTEITAVFTDLGTAFATLMAAGAILFGVVRGGVALFKLASRVFSAAGA
ncbi:hypothetical protein [Azotobacter chroococcum]|uniref:hypothetical protein n=1 Tax=Azotobacter chroococcum TaxID=353 RepID=UPI001D04E8AF|nr:hypothetical protein [Azotobacter chroococcum]